MEYHGCGSHSCKIKKPEGQGTNGPCACFLMCPQEAKVWLAEMTNQRRLLLEALKGFLNAWDAPADPKRMSAAIAKARAAIAAAEGER